MRKTRYKFARVFWVVMALYMVGLMIGIAAVYLTPAVDKLPNWNRFFSWQNLLSQGFSFVTSTVFFYVTMNWFYRLILQRQNWVRFIQPAVLAFVYMAVYYVISFWFISGHKKDIPISGKPNEQLTVGLMIFSYVIATFFSTGLSLLIAYLTYLRDDRKQRKILEEQKMVLEVEKSQANFNFLKAQINPHFLHNTLNFLYAKSLPYSAELSEGILTLSDIMRYALTPAATSDGKVLLKEEIEHVRNVIKINQLRFSNNLQVQFDVTGILNGATIIPFVLITLVENAFKHGDLKSTQHPIIITLDYTAGTLRFYCSNKKKTGAKEISTGIGLDNIKKQLDLTYGKRYTLNVKDEVEFYTTELTINTAV